MGNGIGIFVAEEQEFYREIYRSSFEAGVDFNFIGTSSNGDLKALLKTISSQKTDVLILGARKFSLDLYQEIVQICTNHPLISIVLLITASGDNEAKLLRKLVQKCRSGLGIYLKQSLDNPKQLFDIVRAVHQHQIVLDPDIANSILMERVEYPFMKELTERELEILNLLAQGNTNQGIAKILCIDIKTVARHLNNIYSKLKYDSEMEEKHPRVSVARIYLETTGELMPCNSRNSFSISHQ
ncbi:MAG: response regulator transcription factor [Dehalococcoidales bacterium]|nr:response regulator transcription factor [Dehalococcoidales bacterium]